MSSALKLDRRGRPVLLEKDVVRQCWDWLRAHGWRVERLMADQYTIKARCPACTCFFDVQATPRAPEKQTEPGTPDYAALWCKKGIHRFTYLEFKRPGGKLRKSQEIWIADARKRGWPCLVVDSLESLKEQL